MTWQSVEELQQYLSKNVFHQSESPKKAAGRALGTLVEIITFYLLKSWGFENSILIERKLSEYANPEISHNVEFTLHPSEMIGQNILFDNNKTTITTRKIFSKLPMEGGINPLKLKSGQLLSKDRLLRNACTLCEDKNGVLVAYMEADRKSSFRVRVQRLYPHPFAIIECKRVGIEEGVGKGPQTIEKAKQGAYVARTVSSLQRVRMPDGTTFGVLCHPNGKIVSKPYDQFLKEITQSNNPALLKDFTLTVGVVSNHGNWFTSDDHNKEIKVLAQSYDWLLFLTDEGLVVFITELLLRNAKVKSAFLASYGKTKGQKQSNRFTKTVIDIDANDVLLEYFRDNLAKIEKWFNVISPAKYRLDELKQNITSLVSKDWRKILQ